MSYIQRECRKRYGFTKLQEKRNHIMNIDDILFGKNKKELETPK